MNLLHLDLSAFGPFTGNRLDFSSHRHGLHIIYGPNEAGKSSALRAITCLFYGIPPQTPDNFVHAHKDLRISARISDSKGNALFFTRRKGLKNTLLDEDGDPLPDHILDAYLQGITREMFTTMYGINQHELADGGRALIEGQGDLGESLFAAGMGITGMRKVMRSLEDEAGDLFKPNAKNPKINTLIRDFRQMKKRQTEKSLSAGEWVDQENALKQVKAEKTILIAEWQDLSAEHQRLTRLQTAIPKIVNLKRLQEEREALGETVTLSPDFSEIRRNTEINLGQASAALARHQKDLEEIKKETAAISLDPSLVQARDNITLLFQRSAGFKKALQGLPGKKAEYSRLTNETETILTRLGPSLTLDKTSALRLKDSDIARIRELGRRHAPLEEREKAVHRHIAGLKLNLGNSRNTLKTFPEKKDTSRIEAALGDIRRHGDLQDMLTRQVHDLETSQATVNRELKRLNLWQGSLEQLEERPLPEEATIEKFEMEIKASRDNHLKIAEERLEQETRIRDILEKVETLTRDQEIPDIDDLKAARDYREKGWHMIRAAWEDRVMDEQAVKTYDPSAENLFDAYEKSVQKADHISDRLRNESDRVALLAACKSDLESCRRKKADLDQLFAETVKEYAGVEDEWQTVWEPLAIRPLSPKEMFPWLRKAQHILVLAQEVREKKAAIKGLTHQIQEFCTILKTCLTDSGLESRLFRDSDLTELIIKCEQQSKQVEKDNQDREACRTKIEQIEQDLAAAQTDLEEIRKDLAVWRTTWEQALKPLGLDGDALPSEADVVLDRIQQLFELMDKAAAVKAEIKADETELHEFSADVEALCNRMGKDFNHKPPEEISGILHDQLSTTLTNTARFQEFEKQETAKKKLIREELGKIEGMTAGLGEMCKQAGASTPEELPDIEHRSVKASELERQISEITNELTQYSAGSSLKDFLAEAKNTDADLLPSKIKTLEQEIAVLEGKRSMLDQEIGGRQKELDAMDGRDEAAAVAEEIQGNLAELRDAVARYAGLKVASLVLKNEIEQYREAHKGPVLKRAGDMFSMLTLESFQGVVPDYDEKDNPILMGLRPENVKIPVSGMSDGTCDQLYLALRLASLEQHLDNSDPFPFILDDILVNFDNDRSTACMKILAKLSEKTQILFFTHHRHLVDLVKDHVDKDLFYEHHL